MHANNAQANSFFTINSQHNSSASNHNFNNTAPIRKAHLGKQPGQWTAVSRLNTSHSPSTFTEGSREPLTATRVPHGVSLKATRELWPRPDPRRVHPASPHELYRDSYMENANSCLPAASRAHMSSNLKHEGGRWARSRFGRSSQPIWLALKSPSGALAFPALIEARTVSGVSATRTVMRVESMQTGRAGKRRGKHRKVPVTRPLCLLLGVQTNEYTVKPWDDHQRLVWSHSTHTRQQRAALFRVLESFPTQMT